MVPRGWLANIPAAGVLEGPSGWRLSGPAFSGFPAEASPRDPPSSPGPAPHIHSHEKVSPADQLEGPMAAPKKCTKSCFSQFLCALWGFGAEFEVGFRIPVSVSVSNSSSKSRFEIRDSSSKFEFGFELEMALESASGADFWCKLMSGGRPVDLRGSRGRSPG